MGAKLVFLLVLIIIVSCCFAGCSKSSKYVKPGVRALSVISSHYPDLEIYSDSDTLPANYMQSYELTGEKGGVFDIHYEGNEPVDLMILDAENFKLYNHALDNANLDLEFIGYIYRDRNEITIKFTKEDEKDYYFVIDNTEFVGSGANCGKSVKYTITAS